VAGSGFLNITETEDSDLLVLSSCHNEVSSREMAMALMVPSCMDAVLDVEGMVAPDLEVSVPSMKAKYRPPTEVLEVGMNLILETHCDCIL
jgi:hypothetical protein